MHLIHILSESIPGQRSRRQRLLNFIYHSSDSLRIYAVLTGLSAQGLQQLFHVLDENAWSPGLVAQKTWLGLSLNAACVIATLMLKCANEKNHLDNPAYEDRAIALLAPMMFPIFLVNFHLNHHDIVSFAFLLASYPIFVYLSKVLSTADSSRHVSFSANYPTYPAAKRTEKLLNALFAIGYSSGLQMQCWLYNRERAKESVGLTATQNYLVYAYMLICAWLGYCTTSQPKLFNLMVAISRALRDSALCYASFSGLAYVLLMYAYGCEQTQCWNQIISDHCSIGIILISMISGLHAGLFTEFRFEQNHQGVNKLITLVSAQGLGLFRANQNSAPLPRLADILLLEHHAAN
jgi:hypothetical protein